MLAADPPGVNGVVPEVRLAQRCGQVMQLGGHPSPLQPLLDELDGLGDGGGVAPPVALGLVEDRPALGGDAVHRQAVGGLRLGEGGGLRGEPSGGLERGGARSSGASRGRTGRARGSKCTADCFEGWGVGRREGGWEESEEGVLAIEVSGGE